MNAEYDKRGGEHAITAWIAVTSADPRALPFLVKRIKAMPFLAGALERHLEEFPDPTSGLSRTERQILAAIARGVSDQAELVKTASHDIDPRYPITSTVLEHTLNTLANSWWGKVKMGLVFSGTPL